MKVTLLTEVGDAVCWEDTWGLLWRSLGHPSGDIQKEGGHMGPRLGRSSRRSPMCVGGEACELRGGLSCSAWGDSMEGRHKPGA